MRPLPLPFPDETEAPLVTELRFPTSGVTVRGTFELKHFFAVRLEGASVSGQAVKAMVRRLIDAEPAGRPLADEAIAGLLSRQGVNIARRTVAKYREQLDIAPARERRRLSARQPQLARVG